MSSENSTLSESYESLGENSSILESYTPTENSSESATSSENKSISSESDTTNENFSTSSESDTPIKNSKDISIEIPKKSTTLLKTEDLVKLRKPIRKAIYLSDIPVKTCTPVHWSDRIECKVCGKMYTRSCVSKHRKSQFHRLHEEINKKIKNLLLS